MIKKTLKTLCTTVAIMSLLIACNGKKGNNLKSQVQSLSEKTTEKASSEKQSTEATSPHDTVIIIKQNPAPVKKSSTVQLKEGQIKVQITDADGDYTNLRRSPNGAVAYQLPTSSSYELIVEKPNKGWWLIADNKVEKLGADNKTIELPEGVLMIHGSVLSIQSINEDGQKLSLRKMPNKDAEVTYSFSKSMVFRPLDISGIWIKVSTLDNKRNGWIKIKYLQ